MLNYKIIEKDKEKDNAILGIRLSHWVLLNINVLLNFEGKFSTMEDLESIKIVTTNLKMALITVWNSTNQPIFGSPVGSAVDGKDNVKFG